jgi:hypothetical protein
MTNPVTQGYLENPYLEGNYLAGTAQFAFGQQVKMVITKSESYGMQAQKIIKDEINSLGMEVSRSIANRPKAFGMEMIGGLFKQATIGKQVQKIIENSEYLANQVEAVLIKDYTTGIQVELIIDASHTMGYQVKAQMLDEYDFKAMQTEARLFKDNAQAFEVKRIIKNYLSENASQFKGYLLDRMDSAGMEVRRDKSFPHISCSGFGYLKQPYLTTAYLAAGYCVPGPMQIELLLKKNAPRGMEVNRIVETFTQVAVEVKKVIADKLYSFGMQIERFRATNVGMQVRFILYNDYNLRVLCDFPSRGVTGNNWTSSSTAAGDFSINNVNTDIVEQRWQSVTGVKFSTLVCDTQKTQGIGVDTLAILNHNFTTSAAISLEASNQSDFSTVGFQKNLTINRNEDIYYIAPTYPTQQFRYWRLICNDPTNPDNHLRIGTIVFGSSIIMQGESFVDTVRKRKIHFSDKVETEGYTNVSNDRSLKRAINIDFLKIAYARGNYNALTNVFDYSRTSLKCLWIPDPLKPSRFAVFGKLATMPEETHLNMGTGADYVDFSMEVDESL